MSWASRRRTLILIITFSVIAAIIAVVLIATLYETPTCSDGRENQDEQGIDCGGSCVKVCTLAVQPPVLDFVRDVPGPGGRVDVVAQITNPNSEAAAKGVAYEIELYDGNRTLVATKTGTLELPPRTTVPVYVPNAYAGDVEIRDVQMRLDDETTNPWYRYEDTRALPRVGEVQVGGTEDMPRVTAELTNSSATPLRNVKVIATVFDEADNAIAASQTIVTELPAQGSARATFTWSAPFIGPAARVDVRALLPLP